MTKEELRQWAKDEIRFAREETTAEEQRAIERRNGAAPDPLEQTKDQRFSGWLRASVLFAASLTPDEDRELRVWLYGEAAVLQDEAMGRARRSSHDGQG